MNAYTQRPFTEEERNYAQFMLSYLQRFQQMRPMLVAWRLFFCVSVSTILLLFIVLGVFGQSHLTIALAMLGGFTIGNNINRAWSRAAKRSEEEWDKQWGEQRDQWKRVLEDGVVEVLTTRVSEYILVSADETLEEDDCVAFIPVGESETLCLFTLELDIEDAGSFPGSQLTVIRYPIPGNIYQVSCTGKAPEPLVSLKWSDFAGFASADSFYGWLQHGKIYPLSLDQLGEGLISTE
ncbi:MAG: hypothetical protein QM758_28310 [Armatimonas sp.]